MAIPNWNWEWLVGGNWLARIGVVALIVGAAFFISLAIDRGWLGEAERVILGLIAGLTFMGAGEFYRTRYPIWAQTVAGGGLAILYLSVYGGFALFGLIDPVPAFGLFALITVAGVAQALRQESVGLAVLAIFGGFATPLLLQEDLPDERLLLAYVLVLDMGVLALASMRNWRWFTLLAWAWSLVLFAFWYWELEPSTGLAQIGISMIFLIFAGSTAAFHIVRRRPAGILDIALLTANAIAYCLISYGIMFDAYRPWMGGFTALLAAFYILLVAACRIRGGAPLNLSLYTAAPAVGFAALAVPIQLDGPWVSLAWGVEALVLLWLSFPLAMRELRWSGYLVLLVSAVWVLAVDTPDAVERDLTPFLNLPMIAYAAAVIAPALAAYLLYLRREALPDREQLRMSAPVASFLGVRRDALGVREGPAVTVFAVWAALFAVVAVPVQLEGIWITVAWNVEALLLVWLAFRLRIPELRWSGYVVFAFSGLWLLAVDTTDAIERDLTPFLNLPMIAYAAAVAAPALAAYLLYLRREALPDRAQVNSQTLARNWEGLAVPVFAVWAAFFAVVAVPVQLEGIWITVAWNVEAALLVWLALRLRLPELRWSGYLVFLISAIWLLSADTPDAVERDLTPFLNEPMIGYLAAIVLPVLASYVVYRGRADVPEQEWSIPALAVWGAVVGAVALPVQLDGALVSVSWAAYAVFLLLVSVRLRMDALRWATYVLLAALVIRLAAIETADIDLDTLRPIINWRFLAFGSGIASLYAALWLARRNGPSFGARFREVEATAAPVALFGLATLASLWILSAEILASADSARLNLSDQASDNVAVLGLTLLWAIYGATLMVLGVLRRMRLVRVTGLGLLIVSVIKLFAYDSGALEQEYRVIAFLALGALLVAGGFLYQRHSSAVREFLFE